MLQNYSLAHVVLQTICPIASERDYLNNNSLVVKLSTSLLISSVKHVLKNKVKIMCDVPVHNAGE